MIAPQRGTQVDRTIVDAFFEIAGDGAIVINRARRIINLNPGATRITGWTPRDLTSITCPVFGCRDEQGKRLCAEICLAQRCVESRKTIGPMFLRVTRTDGQPVATEATFIPIGRVGSGAGDACLLLLKELTMLEMLDARVRSLDAALAEKDIVLRGISEQLSTSLRAAMIELRGSAESLRASFSQPLGPQGSKLIDRLVVATQRLETTFAQLKSQIQSSLSLHPNRNG